MTVLQRMIKSVFKNIKLLSFPFSIRDRIDACKYQVLRIISRGEMLRVHDACRILVAKSTLTKGRNVKFEDVIHISKY